MPEPTDTNRIDSKYRLILLAARRARQLQGGARPLVHTTSRKPTRIAQEELKAGVLQFEYLTPPTTELAPPEPVSTQKSKPSKR